MAKQTIWDSIIIGAGAAGLMCAGSFDRPKLVVDNNASAGRKLNITGAGKCNFTNRFITAKDYRCGQKHFCHKALAAFTPQHLLDMLTQAHIPYTETANGCFFARQATDITTWLITRAKARRTQFAFNTQVLQITPDTNGFCLLTSQGKLYARRVVLACGAMSYPQLGATSFAWQAAKQLGLRTAAPHPVLVGLRADTVWRPVFRRLAGQSLPVHITLGKHTQTGPLLFTHEGISGPAVLQISLYWQEKQPVFINFLPELDVLAYLQQHKPNLLFSQVLSPYISAKISTALLQDLNVLAAHAAKNILRSAAERLNHFCFTPLSTTGYAQAEATAGGIEVSQIDSATFQCKTIPNLFIIGEALDVTGPVGGFNLHWAWASAQAVGEALNKS